MFTEIRAHLRDCPERKAFKMRGTTGPYYFKTYDEIIEMKRAHPTFGLEMTESLSHADVANLNKNPNVVISTKGLLAQLFG